MQTRMKKVITWTLVGLVGVIIIASISVYMTMNSIAARAIERVGTSTLEAPVNVDSVTIEVASRTFTINGLTIGNPSGFDGARAFSLDEVVVRADSISMQRLDLAFIDITKPAVFLEINENGTNLGQLKANATSGQNAKKAGGDPMLAEGPSGQASGQSGAPGVVIRRVSLKQAQLQIDLPRLKPRVGPVAMDTITIKGIGEKNSPAPMHQAAAQVLDRVLKAALKKAGEEGYLEKLEGEVVKQLRNRANIDKSFLNKLDSGAEDIGRSIRDAITP